MRIIYLLRHGDVEAAYQGRFRGTIDCGLSPEGEAASIRQADLLIEKGIDLVITSGLKRADFVGRYLAGRGIPHEVDHRFREIDFGAWEGLTWEEAEAALPDIAQAYEADLDHLAFPGGESVEQVKRRVAEAWDDLCKRPFRKVAIIGHSFSNGCLLAMTQNTTLREAHMEPMEIREIQIGPHDAPRN